MNDRQYLALTDRCREYHGHRNRYGYGQIARGALRPNGRRSSIGVHRWAWGQVYGPIPEGMEVMHLCDNPACFLLAHLRLGTHAENMADMAVKGRAGRRTRKQGNGKLTSVQAAEIRDRLASGGPRGFQAAIAREFGISPALVTLIKQGQVT